MQFMDHFRQSMNLIQSGGTVCVYHLYVLIKALDLFFLVKKGLDDTAFRRLDRFLGIL